MKSFNIFLLYYVTPTTVHIFQSKVFTNIENTEMIYVRRKVSLMDLDFDQSYFILHYCGLKLDSSQTYLRREYEAKSFTILQTKFN